MWKVHIEQKLSILCGISNACRSIWKLYINSIISLVECYSNSFMGWQILKQLCNSLMVGRKLTLLRESTPIRKWKLSHCTLCMSWIKWRAFTVQLISVVCSDMAENAGLTAIGCCDTLKRIYSNEEMKAIPSYIVYVMNKKELFHSTIIIRWLFRH